MSFAAVLYEFSRAAADLDSLMVATGIDGETGQFGLQLVALTEGDEPETIGAVYENSTPEEIQELRDQIAHYAAEEAKQQQQDDIEQAKMRAVLQKLSPADRMTINMPLPEDIEALVQQAHTETADAKPCSGE